jgi:hypothetical protein
MADSFMIVVRFPVETVAGHPRRFDWGIPEAQVNRRVGLERLLRRLLDEIREEQQRAFAVLGDINVDVEGPQMITHPGAPALAGKAAAGGAVAALTPGSSVGRRAALADRQLSACDPAHPESFTKLDPTWFADWVSAPMFDALYLEDAVYPVNAWWP